MKLCLRPFGWVLLRQWCVRAGDRLPRGDGARAAFVAYRAVDRPAGLVTDPLAAVRLFLHVYCALARELSEQLPVAGMAILGPLSRPATLLGLRWFSTRHVVLSFLIRFSVRLIGTRWLLVHGSSRCSPGVLEVAALEIEALDMI